MGRGHNIKNFPLGWLEAKHGSTDMHNAEVIVHICYKINMVL